MNWKGNESLKCGVIVHFGRVGSRWVEVVRLEGGGGGGMYVLKLWCLGFKLKRVVGKGYGKYYKGFSWF